MCPGDAREPPSPTRGDLQCCVLEDGGRDRLEGPELRIEDAGPGRSRRGEEEVVVDLKQLVLGCINADVGHQRVIFQYFSKSTRFSQFCAARILKCLQIHHFFKK